MKHTVDLQGSWWRGGAITPADLGLPDDPGSHECRRLFQGALGRLCDLGIERLVVYTGDPLKSPVVSPTRLPDPYSMADDTIKLVAQGAQRNYAMAITRMAIANAPSVNEVLHRLFRQLIDAIEHERAHDPTPGESSASETPDLVAHVVGFRAWRVNGLKLCASRVQSPWRGGHEIRAVCLGGGHDAPAHGCHCGFNAYHQPKHALNHAGPPLSHHAFEFQRDAGMAFVAGVILARGVLEVHGDGFRAEFARPVALMARDTPLTHEIEEIEIPIIGSQQVALKPGRMITRGGEDWGTAVVAHENRLPVIDPEDALDWAEREHGARPVPRELRPAAAAWIR